MRQFVITVALFAALAGATPAPAQSVAFTGKPVLRWYYANGQWYPVYNPGAIRLPARRPPYIIPRGVISRALNNRGAMSPNAYVIGSPEWIAKIRRALPKGKTSTTNSGRRTGFRYRYVYERGPDKRLHLVLRLVPR